MSTPTDERHVTNIFNLEQQLFTQLDIENWEEKSAVFIEKPLEVRWD
jgi:hypothetical protein